MKPITDNSDRQLKNLIARLATKADLKAMTSDIATIKRDLKGMKSDLDSVKTDIANVDESVDALARLATPYFTSIEPPHGAVIHRLIMVEEKLSKLEKALQIKL